MAVPRQPTPHQVPKSEGAKRRSRRPSRRPTQSSTRLAAWARRTQPQARRGLPSPQRPTARGRAAAARAALPLRYQNQRGQNRGRADRRGVQQSRPHGLPLGHAGHNLKHGGLPSPKRLTARGRAAAARAAPPLRYLNRRGQNGGRADRRGVQDSRPRGPPLGHVGHSPKHGATSQAPSAQPRAVVPRRLAPHHLSGT